MLSFFSNFWLLILSRAYSVLETKPNCIGDALKPDQFSKPGDVGFVRDVCVDIVARNVYNILGFPVSKSCEELAKMRTSDYLKCLKWKRSSKRNEKAITEVMDKAVALTRELLYVVSTNMPENTDMRAGELVYEHTKDAKNQLIDSGAAAEDSQLVDILEDMKEFLCKHCTVMDNQDVKDAINQFISNNADRGVTILNPVIEDNIGHATITGLFRLKFEFTLDNDTKTGSAILKIPSLAPFYNTRWKRSLMYVREAVFYTFILPTLYLMGACEPFAPTAFVVTRGNALLLENLSNIGYINVPRLDSLDLNHSKIFLHMLAQYHALSCVYFNNLDENESIKQLLGPGDTIRREIFKNEFDQICEMVKPLLSETIYQKILNAEHKILAELPIQNKNDPNSINVIMHGDLHRKNFLFNYDSDGNVSGVKLIDWQVSTVGNPALELIEFFVHNLYEDIFEANEDYLLEYYLETFNHNLSVLQSNRVYSRLELNRDLEFFNYYYFRVLSDICTYWGASQSSENYDLVARNIAKWIMYFEKKGYI